MDTKKVITFFISLILIFSTFATVSAKEIELTPVNMDELNPNVLYQSCVLDENESSTISPENKELRDCLFEGIYNCQSEIDVSKFNFPPTQETLDKLAALIFYEMPEAFHIGNSMDGYIVGYGDNNYFFGGITPTYECNASEYQLMYKDFEDAVNSMTEDIITHNLNDVQKALVLHDRLVIKCEYDLGIYNGTATYKTYTAYGALVEGKAVCQGYAEAYDYLLEKVGITSMVCRSLQLNHEWNIALINGKYYHIDVTWDDPVFTDGNNNYIDKPAEYKDYVPHKNFLLSSLAMYKNGHQADDFNTAPYDETYDDYFWQKCDKETILIGNGLYHLNKDGGLCGFYEHTEPEHNHGGIGDIDGDKSISATDISYCRKFLGKFKNPTEKELKACDVNEDGKISLTDLVRFKQILIYMG